MELLWPFLIVGIVFANLAVFMYRAVNMGFLANSIVGAAGAAGALVLPVRFNIFEANSWQAQTFSAGAAAALLIIICGLINNLRYRG